VIRDTSIRDPRGDRATAARLQRARRVTVHGFELTAAAMTAALLLAGGIAHAADAADAGERREPATIDASTPRAPARARDDGSGGGAGGGAGSRLPAALETTSLAFPAAPSGPSSLEGELLSPGRRRERSRVGLAVSETLAIHAAMMGWNRWVGAASWAEISPESVRQNLRSGWVRDDDDFWINQFGHPYQGTWSYQAARSTGLGFWTSSAFPVGASALWELTGETTAPSVNDQVTTTVAGIVLGEALWRFSEALRADGGAVNEAVAAILAPPGAGNARLLRRRVAAGPPPSARSVLALGGIAGDAPGAGWPGTGVPPRVFAGVELTWGLPGDPDLELEQPFDHFVLEASYGAAADPVATVRGRGLLAGARLEPGDDVRGLWGLFLSFDLDTTGPYRVSTSALGVGASGRAELGGPLALEGTALASFVLMGGAGRVARPADGSGRDYRLGPGEQLLLDVRLRADPRISAGVTLRQYLIVGDGPGGGTEQLVEARAGVLVRLVGAHAIGAEAARHLRRGRDSAGALEEQGGTAVRFYYALARG
jgi:Domain of unknown function (DUF3943)